MLKELWAASQYSVGPLGRPELAVDADNNGGAEAGGETTAGSSGVPMTKEQRHQMTARKHQADNGAATAGIERSRWEEFGQWTACGLEGDPPRRWLFYYLDVNLRKLVWQ